MRLGGGRISPTAVVHVVDAEAGLIAALIIQVDHKRPIVFHSLLTQLEMPQCQVTLAV